MTAAADVEEPRRARWEQVMDRPLTVAAVVFLVVYAWPILDPARGRGTSGVVLRTVSVVTWALFAVDYLARLLLSRRRASFVEHNLVDLAVVVLPMFRPLRLLRLVKVLGVMNREAGASLRGRVAVYVVAGTGLVVLVSSLAALDAERGHRGATITSYGQALWWAVTTVTTVGYGDVYPVTVEGRLVATGLMLAGIALLGVVTASFASWLLDRVSSLEESSQAATRRDVRELAAEVAVLRGLLESRVAPPEQPSGPAD